MQQATRYAPHRNFGCRLREYLWRGRRCISIENKYVRLVTCPDKGCDILELTHKPTDIELLYQTPRGLSEPQNQQSSPLSGGSFRDQFAGGWFIMMPNGPVPCEHGGASFGHHGEATNLVWNYSIIDDRQECVEVLFRTRLIRIPVALERRIVLTADSGTLSLIETVHNESQQALSVLWGHHPCFGAPFVSSDCEVDLPSGDRMALNEGDNDFTTLTGFDQGHFAILNPSVGVGFSLSWEAALFPVLGIWRQWNGASEYPAYGRRILALEPAVDFPSLADAVAKGTALTLKAGETRTTTLTASVFDYPAKS